MRSAIRISPSQHPDVVNDKLTVLISVVVVFLMWVFGMGVGVYCVLMLFAGVFLLPLQLLVGLFK